jgi:hypothetical protein
MIYICSLPRTGSTILAESLTHWPNCFIHNESLLTTGHYHWLQLDYLPRDWPGTAPVRAASQATIAAYIQECSHTSPSSINVFELYKTHFVVPLLEHFGQVGIKELKHVHWRSLIETFPDTKVLVTCRDPRDILASLLHLRTTFRNESWEWANISNERIAEKLLSEFSYQKEIIREANCLVVPYERLCSDPAIFRELAAFVQIDHDSPGNIGCYTVNNPSTNWQIGSHRGKISPNSIGRRLSLPAADQIALSKFSDLMQEYGQFFGYRTN